MVSFFKQFRFLSNDLKALTEKAARAAATKAYNTLRDRKPFPKVPYGTISAPGEVPLSHQKRDFLNKAIKVYYRNGRIWIGLRRKGRFDVPNTLEKGGPPGRKVPPELAKLYGEENHIKPRPYLKDLLQESKVATYFVLYLGKYYRIKQNAITRISNRLSKARTSKSKRAAKAALSRAKNMYVTKSVEKSVRFGLTKGEKKKIAGFVKKSKSRALRIQRSSIGVVRGYTKHVKSEIKRGKKEVLRDLNTIRAGAEKAYKRTSKRTAKVYKDARRDFRKAYREGSRETKKLHYMPLIGGLAIKTKAPKKIREPKEKKIREPKEPKLTAAQRRQLRATGIAVPDEPEREYKPRLSKNQKAQLRAFGFKAPD